MKRPKKFPNVRKDGKNGSRYRKCGVTAQLGREYGSEAFIMAYEAAVSGVKAPIVSKSPPHSLGLLIGKYYGTPEFQQLADRARNGSTATALSRCVRSMATSG